MHFEVSVYGFRVVGSLPSYFRLTLNDKKDLILDGTTRISLVYFRSGYSPANYPTDAEWNARLVMEKSNAIKCPWIGLQLANTKKVQQILTQPGTVEKHFSGDLDKIHRVRNTFAAIWGLEHDDDETRSLIEDAKKNPHRYVLKPQLEGGGGNFYGEEIITKLQTFSKDELAAHILMQKIQPLAVEVSLPFRSFDFNVVFFRMFSFEPSVLPWSAESLANSAPMDLFLVIRPRFYASFRKDTSFAPRPKTSMRAELRWAPQSLIRLTLFRIVSSLIN